MEPYREVPVTVARVIGEEYLKSIVVILTWDAAHGRVHVTTWGQTAPEKLQAAGIGDRGAEIVGTDLKLNRTHEDFRLVSAAQARLAIEALQTAREAAILCLSNGLAAGMSLDYAREACSDALTVLRAARSIDASVKGNDPP